MAGFAFVARTAVLFGREPGGVDAWYYLSYARAFRTTRRFPVRLPGYLLQEETQSYPPVFPLLIGLLPARVADRWYWAISPFLDCLTLILLFMLALRLTGSGLVAFVAGLAYALSPTLVSETRSLSPRSLGVLLNAVAHVLSLRAALGAQGAEWWAAAVAAAAVLFLASGTGAASFVFVSAVLSLTLGDLRFLGVALAGFTAAFVLSFGHFRAVLVNYAHALRYWQRNRRSFGYHPILDSPTYGGPRATATSRKEQGFLGGGLAHQMVRLLGENPFLLALPFAPVAASPWIRGLAVWAFALSGFAVLSTLLWPLRAFGPGRGYMKAAIFPTAYVLAAGIGSMRNLSSPAGLLTLSALVASGASILFFLGYLRGKKSELTAHVPAGLNRMIEVLDGLPSGGVCCLPGGYSDFVLYRTGRSVLWGSHSGSLDLFQLVGPVWRERVETAARSRGVRYLIVERAWLDPDALGLDDRCVQIADEEGFVLFDLGSNAPPPKDR